jgi:uncharacterized glyoxalase superfamily protein PhnB
MSDEHAHSHEHGHAQAHPHTHPHGHEHPEADPNRVEFIGMRAILNVADVPASLAYYTEKLGFTQSWRWSPADQFSGQAPPTLAQVMRGHCVLFLAQQEQGGPGMWIFLDLETPAELDRLHQEYAAKGARIAEPPADRPWGMREMRVQDLDGHTFRVGAPIGFERA